MQVFNALNGAEVRRILLIEITRALEEQPEFKAHLTMPKVSWKWKLEMEIYPRTPPDLGIEISDTAIQVDANNQPIDISALSPDHIEISSERVVEQPDLVREKLNMPLESAEPGLKRSRPVANQPVEVGRAAQGPQVPLLNRQR